MYETARYSSFGESSFDPGHVKSAEKGKNCICVLADGRNEPTGNEPVGSKVTRIMVENYLRRPSLRDEAVEKITDFANNGVLIKQTPTYRVECSAAALMLQKDSFRWLRAGAVRLYHFVDGQLVTASGEAPTTPLGGGSALRTDVLPATHLGQGENSFLICSEGFARYVRESEMENALSAADSAEQWLRMLKDLYEDRAGGEPYSLMTVFVPSKRRRLMKKPVVIILVLLVLALAVFFGMGALRRGKGPQGGPGGPGGGPGGPNAPTMPPEPTMPAFAQPEGAFDRYMA